MLQNKDLWNRIEAFAFDKADAVFTFSDRLARENGWTKQFAEQAIEEYRRFIYLAATARVPVTPSDIVDQVWHLHLTFTRSYWQELCDGVLGKQIHHGPTLGGAQEDRKYRGQYAATLERYREEFGHEAPLAFWPKADDRFDSAPHQRWVDRRTHFVVAKPSWKTLRDHATGSGLAVVLAGTAAAEEVARRTHTIDTAVGFGILALLVLILIGAAAGSKGKRRRNRKGNNTGDDGSAGLVAGWGASSGSGGKGSGHGHDGKGGDGNGHGGHGGHGGESGGGDGGGCSGGCGGGGCGS